MTARLEETEPTLAAKIEAILYLKGQPVSLDSLMAATGCQRKSVREALLALMDDYARRDRALEIVETPTGFSLQLRANFEALVQDLVPAELRLGALRTLAAIALKGPLLQTELIELRGSSAYPQVQELVEHGFIRKRRQEGGRSFRLELTDKFHQYFQVDELSQVLQQHQTATADAKEE